MGLGGPLEIVSGQLGTCGWETSEGIRKAMTESELGRHSEPKRPQEAVTGCRVLGSSLSWNGHCPCAASGLFFQAFPSLLPLSDLTLQPPLTHGNFHQVSGLS